MVSTGHRSFYIVLTFCLCFIFNTKAQDNQAFAIDSIKKVLPSQIGIERVNSYNELSWYYRNFDVDSALIWAGIALYHAEQDESDAELASAFNSMANSFEALGATG